MLHRDDEIGSFDGVRVHPPTHVISKLDASSAKNLDQAVGRLVPFGEEPG
jgi:hypothetical protein